MLSPVPAEEMGPTEQDGAREGPGNHPETRHQIGTSPLCPRGGGFSPAAVEEKEKALRYPPEEGGGDERVRHPGDRTRGDL